VARIGGCAIATLPAHQDKQHHGSQVYSNLRSVITKVFILTKEIRAMRTKSLRDKKIFRDQVGWAAARLGLRVTVAARVAAVTVVPTSRE
jgi:hypothetical protein